MADKPRVKAPKQRTTTSRDDAKRTKLLMIGGGAFVLLALVVVLFLAVGGGAGVDEASARADLEAAGCTFEAKVPAPPTGGGYHSILEPDGTADDWATDPPTAGAHYQTAAVFGAYEEPLEQARVVHNLEHGGVFIQYGSGVPEATVADLNNFYNAHKTATIMAPLPSLRNKIALGAWVVRDEEFEEQGPVLGTGYLATCATFDDDAFDSFFDAFQFRGPERFDPSDLQPGS
jgi:hypothetical protein